jgi:RHS repeat-associated protein
MVGTWNGYNDSLAATVVSITHGQLDTVKVAAPSGYVNGERCEVHIQSQATDGVWRWDNTPQAQVKYWTYRIASFAEPARSLPPAAPTVSAAPMPSEPMDTVRLYSYGEPVAYAHTLIELNAGFETPTNATFETVLWGNPAYTIGRTDYEYGALGLIATYQDGNVTAPTRYETNVGYFDFATNKRYYYLKDQLGNVRCVVDEQGNVTSWTDYTAYGAIREQNSGTSYDPYKFLTKEHDLETGTEHLDARAFDAWTGRFWQVEPKASDYPQWSSYHYSGNNPIRRSDANGEDWKDIVNGTFNAVAAAVTGTGYQSDGAAYARSDAAAITGAEGNAGDFHTGQIVGNAAAAVIGVAEILGGGGTEAGGGALSLSGAGALAGVPAMAVGDAVAAHGLSTLGNALGNIMQASGNDGGRNEQRLDNRGTPNSTSIKQDKESGKILEYKTYNEKGNVTKAFRGTGRDHGGVKPPLIKEPKKDGGRPVVPRKPNPDELPKGYQK